VDIRLDAGIQQALGLPGANIATNPGSACLLHGGGSRAGIAARTSPETSAGELWELVVILVVILAALTQRAPTGTNRDPP
jgi:hypothetical protein